MTLVTISSANKPMVPRNNSDAWQVCQVNGQVYNVQLDVQTDQPSSVISAFQQAGYSTS